MAEVWLRNLAVTTDPLRHLLLCTLQQVEEDVVALTEGLSEEQVWARPHGVSPVGFHVRHIAESVDRLLTYAEQKQLDEMQLETLRAELNEQLPLLSLIVLLEQRCREARRRLGELKPEEFAELRYIGRAKIPVPLGTLLTHIAEHASRHLGQITTTVKVLRSTGEAGHAG